MADAGHRFIQLVGGVQKQRTPLTTSSGAADGGKVVQTDPATGKLDTSLMPAGLGADQSSAVASENLASGDQVNLWNDGGTLKARKANASDNSKPSHGFVSASVTSGATATVIHDGTISGLSGLTVGAEYYLGTTGGAITATAPSSTGNSIQPVGVAKSATELIYEYHRPTEIE